MKILPHDNVLVRVEDVLAGFNHAPKVGDDGHVDDHARLSQAMFDVPQTTISLGYAAKVPGEGWLWNHSLDPDEQPQSATFTEIRTFAERIGVAAMAEEPHAAADGETDWTEDSSELDGVQFNILASGVFGLSHAVGDLIQQVNALKAAQA